MDNHILTLLIALPLIGALFIGLFIRGDDEQARRNARQTALWCSLVTFITSLYLWVNFDNSTAAYQFVEHVEWFREYNISYHLGVDGISLFMVLLTTFLMPLCILSGWKGVTFRLKEYMIAFLVLESFVIGVFCALDLVLFYLFFEGMLIPMYLIIGIWGGDRRVYAAVKFFLYTLLGSVLMLLAIIYLYREFGTMSIPAITEQAPGLDRSVQHWLWLAFFASFAVKVPMWPVHTWLPDAHVQAPTAGSVILAGVLLKMGAYGFLRFSLPMFPDASEDFQWLVYGLSIIAVIYTSLVALMQEDMKKLIAYSSIAHMGFVTAGIFSFTAQGIEGAIIQMISHGLVSGALFMCVGVVYDRIHSREIARYGGLVSRMPYYAFAFMFFTMASVGLPGTSGFVGEFLILMGTFQSSTLAATLLATGLVLGAAYALWLYRRVVFGEITRADLSRILDIDRREALMFLPLVLVVLWMGIYPKPYFDAMHASVNQLLEQTGSITPGTPLPEEAPQEAASAQKVREDEEVVTEEAAEPASPVEPAKEEAIEATDKEDSAADDKSASDDKSAPAKSADNESTATESGEAMKKTNKKAEE
jgi:NADH-quinone oxidoreductase subunit M